MNYVGLESEHTVFRPGEDNPEHADPAIRDDQFAEERDDLVLLPHAYSNFTQPTGHLSWHLWLRSGGRFYADQSAWEYATPECPRLSDLILADKAGEFITTEIFSDLEDAYIMKRSANKWMNSTWGFHENYSLGVDLFNEVTDSDKTNLHRIIMEMHLVSRIIFTGSGHIQINPTSHEPTLVFWISPRAKYISERISGNTRGARGIINSRDESLSANHTEDKRLHVICGDANRSDWSTYLKFGTTRLLLAWLRTSTQEERLSLVRKIQETNPASVMERTSRAFMDGRAGLDVFRRMLYVQELILEEIDSEKAYLSREVPEVKEVVEIWGRVLDELPQALHNSRNYLSDKLDWLIKKRLFEEAVLDDSLLSLRNKSVYPGSDLAKRISSLDFNYHRLGDSDLYRELIDRGFITPMATYEEAKQYAFQPPSGRARVRVRFIDHLRDLGLVDDIKLADWHCVDIRFDEISDFRRFHFRDDNLIELKSELNQTLIDIRG